MVTSQSMGSSGLGLNPTTLNSLYSAVNSAGAPAGAGFTKDYNGVSFEKNEMKAAPNQPLSLKLLAELVDPTDPLENVEEYELVFGYTPYGFKREAGLMNKEFGYQPSSNTADSQARSMVRSLSAVNNLLSSERAKYQTIKSVTSTFRLLGVAQTVTRDTPTSMSVKQRVVPMTVLRSGQMIVLDHWKSMVPKATERVGLQLQYVKAGLKGEALVDVEPEPKFDIFTQTRIEPAASASVSAAAAAPSAKRQKITPTEAETYVRSLGPAAVGTMIRATAFEVVEGNDLKAKALHAATEGCYQFIPIVIRPETDELPGLNPTVLIPLGEITQYQATGLPAVAPAPNARTYAQPWNEKSWRQGIKSMTKATLAWTG